MSTLSDVPQHTGARTDSTSSTGLDDMLRLAVQLEATDLHLKVGRPPAFRVGDELVTRADLNPLRAEDLVRSLHQVTDDRRREHFQAGLELVCAYALAGVGRFRVSASVQRGTISMSFRRLPVQAPSLDDLRLPSGCKELIMRPRGLILVTGPSGSGRSTTLASMVEYMNERRTARVETIECPIEYQFQDKRCLVTQRELGIDAHSAAPAIRQAMRQDADVIMLHELSDEETTMAALQAAEAGHLVLSTLSTPTASRAVDRVLELVASHLKVATRELLANVIEGVVSQTLLPLANGGGRVAAVELMMATSAIRSLIRESKTHQLTGVIETSQRSGMRTLDQALLELYRRGTVTLEAIMVAAPNPERLRGLVQVR